MELLKRLISRFKDPDYRRSYAESFVDSYLATQIKVLREKRELTQAQLAALADVKQSQISRWESVNNSSWQIRSLKNLARAMDLVLVVRFESFGQLLPDVETFSRGALERYSFDNDPIFADTVAVAATVVAAEGDTDVERCDTSTEASLTQATATDSSNVFHFEAYRRAA